MMRRYQVRVAYEERPGEWVELYSAHADGLYTESAAKARVTREHKTSWQRGLTLTHSQIERIDPLT
ncbi:hypothetical protein B7H26_04780 [Stenotrophomonas maltophilia]|nr:hypothetical protein B7H26_04780 [Stenotrophomonas maltophilia]MBH1451066.1 hypothetical protein [Stenotrophomonas maltophilia]